MKLERIKCKPLERAKDLCVSRSYIVGCTGQKAAILDKQRNLLHTVEGLEYVYSAEVSPDETKLLLISNGNKFYIVDLYTYEKTRITVKAPYNYNLEGRGCWSFDGRSLWIPIQHSGTMNSTLRCYCADDLSQYSDYLADKYCITGIMRLEAMGSFFMTGYHRQENRYYFIYFDGSVFREYPLDANVNIVGATPTVDAEKGVVTVASVSGCRQFTLEGKLIKTIPHPAPKSKKIGASDVFMHLCDGDTEKQKHLKELSNAYGMENVSAPDNILKYAPSSDGRYTYLASDSGFYLLDGVTGAVLASVPEAFGVQSFEEISPELIALATWSGVKLYQISNQ